jgi:ribosome-associated protein
MTTEEKVATIVGIADDMKAEEIETLDVRGKTSIADFFVVCSANNDRLVTAIAEKVEEKMKQLKDRPLRTEGGTSGWILQDYGDVVFHVMRDEQRQFYDLETLWKTMQPNANDTPGSSV